MMRRTLGGMRRLVRDRWPSITRRFSERRAIIFESPKLERQIELQDARTLEPDGFTLETRSDTRSELARRASARRAYRTRDPPKHRQHREAVRRDVHASSPCMQPPPPNLSQFAASRPSPLLQP